MKLKVSAFSFFCVGGLVGWNVGRLAGKGMLRNEATSFRCSGFVIQCRLVKAVYSFL